jgi:predicted ATP-dependent serine protease
MAGRFKTKTREERERANFRQGAQDASHGPNGSELSLFTPSQIIAWEDDPKDLILPNGYLEKGAPCVICGPPGIGKTRLTLQLATHAILELGFLGWETQGEGLKWLFLQREFHAETQG